MLAKIAKIRAPWVRPSYLEVRMTYHNLTHGGPTLWVRMQKHTDQQSCAVVLDSLLKVGNFQLSQFTPTQPIRQRGSVRRRVRQEVKDGVVRD